MPASHSVSTLPLPGLPFSHTQADQQPFLKAALSIAPAPFGHKKRELLVYPNVGLAPACRQPLRMHWPQKQRQRAKAPDKKVWVRVRISSSMTRSSDTSSHPLCTSAISEHISAPALHVGLQERSSRMCLRSGSWGLRSALSCLLSVLAN